MKKAFTIVELLLYIGLFSILVTILGNIFLSIIDLQLQSRSSSNISQNLDYLFTRFAYDIYRASSVTNPPSSGNSGSTLVLSIGGQNYSYGLSGSNLILTTPSGSYTLNSYDTSVTAFTVTRIGGTKPNLHLGITLTSLTHSINRPSQTVSYSSSFTLR